MDQNYLRVFAIGVLEESILIKDRKEFARSIESLPDHDHFFETHYSVGHVQIDMTHASQRPQMFFEGGSVSAVDGVFAPLILHETGPGHYRIGGSCYLWAAPEFDYWNPGTRKGRWETRHHGHGCEQTRMITIW